MSIAYVDTSALTREALGNETQAMTNQKMADLTVGEFKELFHDIFAEIVQDIFDKPDCGLALREETAERLGRSLADVDAGGETISHAEVVKRLRAP